MFESLKNFFTVGRTYSLHAEVLKESAESNEYFFYGLVGDDITASKVIESLKGSSGDLDIHLFSLGGDLFEAAAIYGILNQYPGKVTIYIEGLAASAGAYVAVAADELVMEENAMLMVHNAWKIASGNHNELREQADLVEKQQEAMVKAFATKTGKDREEIIDLMDDETWMDANEAVEAGFADRIYENENKVAAEIDSDSVNQFNFKNIPEKFKRTQNQTNNIDMEFSEEQLKKLGLDADASEEEIKAAIMEKVASEGSSPSSKNKEDDETPKSEKGAGESDDEPKDEVSELKATVSNLQERLDKKDQKDEEERAESLVNSAISDGKINPADKEAWLTAAKANFDNTKQALDKREPNSSMPGAVNVDTDAGNGNGGRKQNSTEQCADYLRAQMGS